jgi:hypothetical protein
MTGTLKGDDMSDEKKNEKPAEVDNLEVEPLTDEDLESVPGGTYSPNLDCSCTETGGNCTA